MPTFENVRFYEIDAVIPIGAAKTDLKDQTHLRNKEVVAIFAAGESKDQNNNTLTNTGFYLQLEEGNKEKNVIPSIFLDFNKQQSVSINFRQIIWEKSQVILPTAAAAITYIKLIVLYRE